MKKPYKLITFLFFITIACFVFNCSKKDNTSPVSIAGKWSINADTAQTFGYAPYIIVGINSPYFQFNANGTGTQKENIGTPDYILNFTYSVVKDTIFFNYPEQPGTPGSTQHAIIKTLTANNLLIEYYLADGYTAVGNNYNFTEKVYMSR